MYYDYEEEMTKDIKEAIIESIPYTDFYGAAGWSDMFDYFNDEFWYSDNVTGNASGSYFFNSYKAAEAIMSNWDLMAEALEENGCKDRLVDEGPEWADVTIRCYLLSSVLKEVLRDLDRENYRPDLFEDEEEDEEDNENC